VRALANSGLKVLSIEDITPLPHNGCRARKKRRV
jgi:small subunit ribosomal protein S11